MDKTGKAVLRAALGVIGLASGSLHAAEPPGQTYNINLVYTSDVTTLQPDEKTRLGELADAGINTILVNGWTTEELKANVAKARADAVLSRFRFMLDVAGPVYDAWHASLATSGGATKADVCEHGPNYLPQGVKDYLDGAIQASLSNTDFTAGYYTFDEPALRGDSEKPIAICKVYQEAVRRYIRDRDPGVSDRPVAVSNTLAEGATRTDYAGALSVDAQDVAFVDQYGLSQMDAYHLWNTYGLGGVPQVYVHASFRGSSGGCASNNLTAANAEPALTEDALQGEFGNLKPLARGHAYFAFRPNINGHDDFAFNAANCAPMLADIKAHLSSLPDLRVVSITTTPAEFQPGDAVTFNVTVENQGNLHTNHRWLGVLFQVDGQCAASGCLWGGTYDDLVPGQRETIAIRSPWTATAGRHEISVLVDDAQQIKETNEFNNTLVRTITVGTKPDLVPVAFSLDAASITPGSSVAFSTRIENQGSVAMPYGWLGAVYLIDGGCPADGCLWGGAYSAPGGLMPGEATDLGTHGAGWVAQAGPHEFRVLVDDQNVVNEASEDNNTMARQLIVATKPDLRVTAAAAARPHIRVGDSVPFLVTISNQGGTTVPAGAIGVAVHDHGACLATGCPWAIVPSALAPGASVQVLTSHDSWTADNAVHQFEAVVDDRNTVDEADEANNVTPFNVQVNP